MNVPAAAVAQPFPRERGRWTGQYIPPQLNVGSLFAFPSLARAGPERNPQENRNVRFNPLVSSKYRLRYSNLDNSLGIEDCGE
jgi:hypothetical protein